MNRAEYLIRLSKGKEHMCANCEHYHEHYVHSSKIFGNRYVEIDAGHCTYPRLKNKKAWNTCEHWKRKEE